MKKSSLLISLLLITSLYGCTGNINVDTSVNVNVSPTGVSATNSAADPTTATSTDPSTPSSTDPSATLTDPSSPAPGQPSHEMIPFDTDHTGVYAGYYFIPIDGQIYRFYSAPEQDHNITLSDLIFECTETGIGENFEHYIYELQEYPDHSVLFAMCKDSAGDTLSEQIIACKSAEGASQEDIDRVMNSGYVILEDGSVVSGKDAWLDFYEKTTSGESATIRVAYIYTLDKENCSYEYYEAVKDDYPALFLKEITYDGQSYTCNPLHYDGETYSPMYIPGYDNEPSSWKYLVRFTGEPYVSDGLYTAYDRFVLVDEEAVTWRELEWGVFSSQTDDCIPYEEVFCEYTWR